MQPVKELDRKTIPSLSSDKMGALLARLEELGVTCVDDLIDVQAQDLDSHSDSSELSKPVNFSPA